MKVGAPRIVDNLPRGFFDAHINLVMHTGGVHNQRKVTTLGVRMLMHSNYVGARTKDYIYSKNGTVNISECSTSPPVDYVKPRGAELGRASERDTTKDEDTN